MHTLGGNASKKVIYPEIFLKIIYSYGRKRLLGLFILLNAT